MKNRDGLAADFQVLKIPHPALRATFSRREKGYTTQVHLFHSGEDEWHRIIHPMPDSMDRNLVAEEDIRALPVGSTLRIPAKALVTPLAADLARERSIVLERVRESRRIAIGADHGGFEMKEELKKVLEELRCEYHDFGTHSVDAVDYPDFAQAVALAVARGACDLGIMIDGAGIGSCMVANKIRGIRAAMCYDEASARNSREHNGANVLTLGGKTMTHDRMREIVHVWLSTDLTEERHRRRVAKIDAVL